MAEWIASLKLNIIAPARHTFPPILAGISTPLSRLLPPSEGEDHLSTGLHPPETFLFRRRQAIDQMLRQLNANNYPTPNTHFS